MVQWFIAHSLVTLYGQFEQAYPGRSKAADGTIGDAAHAARTSDHNPRADGEVCARDFTNDPPLFVSRAHADYLAAHRDVRVKYIISDGRIFSHENGVWAWRPYSGVNGHFHHFHLSVYPDTNAARWNILMPPEEKPPVQDNEEDDTMVMVQAGSGIVLVVGDQRYGLNITQVRELIAQGVKVVKFDSAALNALGDRILAGTPAE